MFFDFNFFWTKDSTNRVRYLLNTELLGILYLHECSKFIDSKYFFDIGSNIGFFSLTASLIPSIQKIYSFEPSKEIFLTLQQNIELNGLDEIITPVNKAISDKEEAVNFLTNSNLEGIGSIKETSIHSENKFKKTIQLNSLTIDNFINLENKIITFKIDVEGHEFKVLKGASKTLIKNTSILMIEAFDSKEVIDYLKTIGYRILFKIKSNFFFTNSEQLIKSKYIIFESMSEKFVDLCSYNWPNKFRQMMHIEASIKKDIIEARIDDKTNLFSNETMFCFEIFSNNEKIHSTDYQSSNKFLFQLTSSTSNKFLSIRGMIMDKKFPRRILSKLINLN